MQKFRMNVDAVWTLNFQYTNPSLKPTDPFSNWVPILGFIFFSFFFFFSLRNLDQFLNFTLQENQMAERHARVPKHWRSWPNFWLSLSDQPHQMFILAKGRPNLCRLQNIERAFHFRQPNALKNGNSTWLFYAVLVGIGCAWQKKIRLSLTLCGKEREKSFDRRSEILLLVFYWQTKLTSTSHMYLKILAGGCIIYILFLLKQKSHCDIALRLYYDLNIRIILYLERSLLFFGDYFLLWTSFVKITAQPCNAMLRLLRE